MRSSGKVYLLFRRTWSRDCQAARHSVLFLSNAHSLQILSHDVGRSSITSFETHGPLFQASDDPSNRGERTIRILHPHGLKPNLLRRIVIATRKDSVADKHHLLKRDPTCIA
jgi:hypothetical protein